MPYDFDESFFGIESRGDDGRRTLTEVCSPVFLFLTTFRRNSQASDIDPDELRTRLKDVLEEARRRLDSDPRLRKFLDDVWYVLVATADQAVLSSSWKGAGQWRMSLLESEYFSMAMGGQRFYEILEKVLAQPGDEAAELSELMFTCMALGFQGELMGDSRRFERRRLALYEKGRLPGALGDHLTPDAYGRNDKRTSMMLPKVGMARVVLVCLAVLFVLYLIGTGLTKIQADEVRAKVDEVIEQV